MSRNHGRAMKMTLAIDVVARVSPKLLLMVARYEQSHHKVVITTYWLFAGINNLARDLFIGVLPIFTLLLEAPQLLRTFKLNVLHTSHIVHHHLERVVVADTVGPQVLLHQQFNHLQLLGVRRHAARQILAAITAILHHEKHVFQRASILVTILELLLQIHGSKGQVGLGNDDCLGVAQRAQLATFEHVCVHNIGHKGGRFFLV